MDPLPVLTEYSEEEKQICDLQQGFAARLRKSQYYITEPKKSAGERTFLYLSSFRKIQSNNRIELPRYSDKYRPSLATQPTLKRKDLHQAFFPQEIFEGYFNPKKRKIGDKKAQKKRLNLDDVVDDAEEKVR